jgi:peptidoglycan/LPS O-acetylase OafA/YrhL
LSAVIVLIIFLNNSFYGQYTAYWWHENFLPLLPSNALMLQNLGVIQGIGNQTINDPSWSIAVEFWISGLVLYPLARKNWYVPLALAMVAYEILCLHSAWPLQAISSIGAGFSGGIFRGIGGIAAGSFIYKIVSVFKGHKFHFNSDFSSLAMAYNICAETQHCVWISLFSFMIFVGVLSLEDKKDRIIGARIPAWLGKISFSIYLMHTPVILFVGPGTYARHFGQSLAVLYVMILIMIVSTFTHYGFEVPSQRYLYSLLKGNSGRKAGTLKDHKFPF